MSNHTISLKEDGYIVCSLHNTWCDELRNAMNEGQDADLFSAGMRINVPIIPDRDLYAIVKIDDELYGTSALMQMEYTPDIGRAFTVQLGFWNPGEGCYSIRSVIHDYLKSKIAPGEKFASGEFKTRCPNSAHSMKSARIMSERCSDPVWKWECLWNIVMEKACTPCIAELSGTPDDNFGVTPDLAGTNKPWSR